MAPVRPKKRVSEPSTAAKRAARLDAIAAPVKTEKPAGQSPTKRSRVGITLAQKQALIENLHLELTERARRLRSQYNLQAQGLHTRVEIRVNRIPMALRRLKMGDLIAKHIVDQQRRIASASKPPPVPAKDYPPLRAASPQKTLFGPLLPSVPRSVKRKSDHIAQEKENVTTLDSPRKKTRASPDQPAVDPAKILSPTSSNFRNVPRAHEEKPLPPPKPQASRPASPVKAATLPASGRAANMVPNAVEKAKATRTVTASRKPDLPPSSTSTGVNSSTTGYAAPRTTVRKATAPVPAPVQPPSRQDASSREGKRLSDSSDASGDRKRTASRAGTVAPAPASTTKRSVMGTIRKGVAGAASVKKASAPKASTASTGRVLRRRA
jgi:hypothetical protein